MKTLRTLHVILAAAILSAAATAPALADNAAAGKVAPKPSQRVIQTPMAKVRFGTRLRTPVSFSYTTPSGQVIQVSSGTEIPGLIVSSNKGVTDPKAETITPQVQNVEQIEKADVFIDALKNEFAARAQYLSGTNVPGPSQQYIAMGRKQQLVDSYVKLLGRTRMNAQQKSRAMIALEQITSRIAQDVSHQPAIGQGVAADYHPYWSPYDRGLELLRDVAHDEVRSAVRSALNYVARRKTALGGSEIKEWDAESSLGLRVAADTDAQESVSIKKGTENDYTPSYVTLSLPASGLPSELSAHAGKAVYRVGTDYYLDGSGTKLPASAERHLVEKPIQYAQMTLRKVKAGEKLRQNFKFDWTGSGGIDVTPVDISWWGHCHIEAPLAALGVEAKTKVHLFNASTKKAATFDPDRSNDLLFALYDAEQMMDPATNRGRQLDKTTFVGARNDAIEGFGDQILIRAGGRAIPITARLFQIYSPSGGAQPVDQTFLFQRDIPSNTGLNPNPDFLRQVDGDVHVIKGDRKVVAEIKHPEWDSGGFERERRQWVTIDPRNPGRAFIAAQIRRSGNGGVLTKYYLNLRDKTIESLSWKGERLANGTFKRTLINQVSNAPAPPGEEFAGIGGMPKFDIVQTGVSGFDLSREVEMEGATEISDFLADAIRHNKGAVVETSPNGPVWNFPMDTAHQTEVSNTGQDRIFHGLNGNFERVQMRANNRQTVVSRTRDAKGKVQKSEFSSPFLDFAWRPEQWHALPFARGLVNYDALKRGYLFGKNAQGQVSVTDGFYGMASDVLYLSMVDPSKQELWGIRHKDGKLEYFDSEQAYKARVAQLP